MERGLGENRGPVGRGRGVGGGSPHGRFLSLATISNNNCRGKTNKRGLARYRHGGWSDDHPQYPGVNRSSWCPWPTLARSEPTRMASAGGQLRALNGLQSRSPRDLAIGIDASEINGEINGPVWFGIRPRDYGGL
jgi:hypothetical protein